MKIKRKSPGFSLRKLTKDRDNWKARAIQLYDELVVAKSQAMKYRNKLIERICQLERELAGAKIAMKALNEVDIIAKLEREIAELLECLRATLEAIKDSRCYESDAPFIKRSEAKLSKTR